VTAVSLKNFALRRKIVLQHLQFNDRWLADVIADLSTAPYPVVWFQNKSGALSI